MDGPRIRILPRLAIAPFLPPSLIRAPRPERLPHARAVEAALLLADISGFTALTEKLQERGPEGAELIAGIVSGAFEPAIRLVERHGGSIETFGGDALFATFEGQGRTRRAHAAAEGVLARFAQARNVATPAGPVTLGIRLVLHHGKARMLHLGRDERRQYVVDGPAVRHLATLEERAGAGTLTVSRAAAAALREERQHASRRARAREAGLASYVPPLLQGILAGFRGEYRRASILFLATRPASLAWLQRWFLRLHEVLEEYGGLLLKVDLSSAGTKWLVAFGLPHAHEDDPDRCARAALDLARGAGAMVRGAMHAGVVANVIVGAASRRCYDVMGDVVNTSARALARAGEGSVLVTAETRELLAGMETEPRGLHEVKGKAAPLELHALVRRKAVARRIRLVAPMVGREPELERIAAALGEAAAGRGSALGIRAEPGLGKSRLKYEAARLARARGFEVHEGRAISFGGMAYWTIASLVRDALAIPELAEPDEVLERVSRAAEQLSLRSVDRHHVADLLGARYPDSPIDHLLPRQVHDNLLAAVRAVGARLVRTSPRLYVLEDMHWADAASAEAAAWLARGAADGPQLMLLLYRPGYAPPPGVEELVLRDLPDRAMESLLQAHLGMVPPVVARLVRERAGGNPFYVEELVRHLLESGLLAVSDEGYVMRREPGAAELPLSIEALIAARLDGLSAEARSVSQHAAVVGRSFLLELLAELSDISAFAPRAVEELTAHELVFLKSAEPHLEYIFKHALTRDVAYGTLLASHRRAIHAAVADAIETVLGRRGFEAMLAHHRERAGWLPEARAAYLAGARHALTRHALIEAEELLRRYLAIADEASVERVAARNQLASEVLLPRGAVAEAEELLARSIDEVRQLGAMAEEAASHLDVAKLRLATGRWTEAEADAREALRLSGSVGRDDLASRVHVVLGQTLQCFSRFAEGQVELERAIELARSCDEPALEVSALGALASLNLSRGALVEARTMLEVAVASARRVGMRREEGRHTANLATVLRDLQSPQAAQEHYELAIAIAREVGDRALEGQALGNLAIVHKRGRRMEAATELYAQALAVSREVADRRSEGIWNANLGLLHVHEGNVAPAREVIVRGIAIARELAERRLEGAFLVNLARVELLDGQLARAAELVSEGVAILRAIGANVEHAGAACFGGHVALAMGADPDAWISEARMLLAELRVAEDSIPGRDLASLERAAMARREGRPLVCGAVPEDVPEGWFRYLRRHRPGELPAELRAPGRGNA